MTMRGLLTMATKTNAYKTLGARCNFIIESKNLTPKQKELIKIIMDYKKNCGCFYK